LTDLLHIVLIVASFATFIYVVLKIRKAQFQIADAIFWVFFFLFLFTLGAFPQIGSFFSRLFGFDAPVNFILVAIIFVLLIKVFLQSFQISQLDSKIRTLSQRIALDQHEAQQHTAETRLEVKENEAENR